MYKDGFFKRFRELQKDIAGSKNKDLISVVARLGKFLRSGNYSKYKKANILSSNALDGQSDHYIAMCMGIAESTVRVQRRNLSIELFTLFGEDFFLLFEDFRVNRNEILRRMYIVENLGKPLEELMFFEVLSAMDSYIQEDSGIVPVGEMDLAGCSNEISFLTRHSRGSVEQELSTLDRDKLLYVLRVLKSECGSFKDRYKLMNLFTRKGGEN